MGGQVSTRADSTLGKRCVEIVGEGALTDTPKLTRKFGARCWIHACTCQPSPGTMRQIGDLKVVESVLIADVSHLFHSFECGPSSLQRNR